MTEAPVGGSRARVGVVVVHFGDPAPTLACLSALRDDRSLADREVVIVDNSENLAIELSAGERVVVNAGNRGYGAGANAGVASLSPGEWDAFVILNNDVEVASGFLGAAAGAVAQPRAGAAAGPLYLDRIGGELWFAGGSVNYLLGTVRQARSVAAARQARAVGFLSGAALAISPAAWRAVGGFDTRYFLYHEDLDLCLRLRRAGFSLRFVPEMAAIHRLGETTGSRRYAPFYLEHLTASRLRPFRPLAYRLYLALLHTGYVGLRAARHWVAGDRVEGRAAASALIRGHLTALSALLEEPRRQQSCDLSTRQ
jgi:GT2 family glycosyltransferase